METRTFSELIQGLIGEEDTALFLASQKRFAQKVVHGKWFLPHRYPSARAFKKNFKRQFGRGKWVILDIQNLPSECLAEASLEDIYEIAKLSKRYGPEPVRGFHFHFKRLPTTPEFETFFQGTYKNEIEFVYHYLRKTGEIKKLSAWEKRGGPWRRFLFRRRRELIPYQFISLSGFENEALIFLREGLE